MSEIPTEGEGRKVLPLFLSNIDYHLAIILKACEEIAASTTPIMEDANRDKE